MKVIRNEYPSPQFKRSEWKMLNGKWDFWMTNDKSSLVDLSALKHYKIEVPFSYQYPLSGINIKDHYDVLYYQKTFNLTQKEALKGVLLHFNASDYETYVYINDKFVGTHIGGFDRFSFDITNFIHEGENKIFIKVIDTNDLDQVRGKQSPLDVQYGCWYYPNSGIYGSVWIEFFEGNFIEEISVFPNIDEFSVEGFTRLNKKSANKIRYQVIFKNKIVHDSVKEIRDSYDKISIKFNDDNFVDDDYLWKLSNPNLFNLIVTIYKDEKVLDTVETRFGMRKISIDKNGQILLNNSPLYQKLILDQGYYPEGGLTSPSINELKNDILKAKDFGFNGARKHQKIEDPYFYYFADELGYLVWLECPSAYMFTNREISNISNCWLKAVGQHINYPSIISYIPLNESWGVRKIVNDDRMKNFAKSLYYITKAIDPTRLISTNDGWEAVGTTDFIGVHDYAFDDKNFEKLYNDFSSIEEKFPQPRRLFAYEEKYQNQPVLMSEFGGIAIAKELNGNEWGYNSGAKNDGELVERIDHLVKGIKKYNFQGYCYTQLRDVQQEKNGLLDESGKPKIDPKILRKVFE